MIHPWITVLVAILYICMLFAVASYGDRVRVRNGNTSSRPNIYALSMAVYCTTWTFFGSVGLAATSGWSFLAIYVGPILVVTVGYPVLRRIVSLSKAERITSVADFLASRYGKNSGVAAVGVIIAVIGTIPYIALQLKAIAGSVDTLFIRFSQGFPTGSTPFEDITLLVTVTLAVFAVLFGTRHADATEHQHGLMLAVAMESVIKLIAFLAVGAFVTWIMFDGFGDLASRAFGEQKVINLEFNASEFAVLTFLSLIVFLLLPRQFHVAVVENNSDAELRRARWLFPAYLCLINLFVIPIAIAGTLRFGLSANADDYVLLLPILEGQRALGLLVFIGGLSAGTAMVIVASVALAIMISNDLVLPFMLKSSEQGDAVRKPASMEGRILNIRRTAIFGVLALAFIYYSAADNTAALASIGLVSFAAIAQLAPAFFIGMIWKQANARGAMLGMVGGFFVWAYCLLVPTLLPENSSLLQNGPFSIALLRPQALFGLELSAIANGVIWSLAVNSALFFIGSKSRHSEPLEVVQASRFSGFKDNHADGAFARISSVRMHHLKETLGRYLGPKRANRAFDAYLEERGIKMRPDEPVDGDMLQFSEQLLASAVGTSSSRLVHTLLIQRHEQTGIRNLELLDEASRAIQFNRDMLQTAFDQLEQGITVFDGNFRLASWNRQFRHILKLPDNIGRAGISINQVCETIVANNALSENGWSGERLAKRLQQMRVPWQLELRDTGCVVEIGTSTMPEGGIVVTWHDITQRVEAARALRDANETLEKRVEERTRELEAAKQLADQANASKTRFLAAASHDIAQPLNAARLYSTTLSERMSKTEDAALADNIGKSLGSVEEILGSILAISRLDTASPETRIVDFPLRRITSQLEIEFQPLAKQAGLELRFVHSSKWVRSDPALLRRMLQNLVSNALKFTRDGRVLVGARRRGESVELNVHDTGIGISVEDQKLIFGEFTRLNEMVGEIPGLGLGLSIVDRIANLLGHKVDLVSIPGKGTRFSILVEATEPAEETASVSRLPMRNISNLSGLKVLCVDNEPSILSGMEALLGQWGCIVSCARNLEEAVAVCKQGDTDPQIMLIDYHLDNTTGVALFREIKRHLDHLPLGVLITADRSERVKSEAEDEAMTILNKPVKPASLRALLSRNHHSGVAAE